MSRASAPRLPAPLCQDCSVACAASLSSGTFTASFPWLWIRCSCQRRIRGTRHCPSISAPRNWPPCPGPWSARTSHCLPRGAHLLRHTFATQLVQQGTSLKVVADLLGHQELHTAGIYAKANYPMLAALAQPWPEVAL